MAIMAVMPCKCVWYDLVDPPTCPWYIAAGLSPVERGEHKFQNDKYIYYYYFNIYLCILLFLISLFYTEMVLKELTSGSSVWM